MTLHIFVLTIKTIISVPLWTYTQGQSLHIEFLLRILIPYCAFHNTLLLALYNSLLFPLFCFIITYFLHKEKTTLSVFRKCRLFILGLVDKNATFVIISN